MGILCQEMEEGFWRVWIFYHPKQWFIWVKNGRVLLLLFDILLQELELNIEPFWSLGMFSSRLCRKLFLLCRLNSTWTKMSHLNLGSNSVSGAPLFGSVLVKSSFTVSNLPKPSPHGWAGEEQCSHVAVLLLTAAVNFPGSPGSLSTSNSRLWFSQCILDKAERSGGMSRDVKALCHSLRCLYAWLIIA